MSAPAPDDGAGPVSAPASASVPDGGAGPVSAPASASVPDGGAGPVSAPAPDGSAGTAGGSDERAAVALRGVSPVRGGRRGAAWVFGIALAARLAVVAWAASRIPPTADGSFYHTIAWRIARGLGYTWLWPDGAVTNAGHYPIGYPALVGAAYALAGPRPAAAMVVNALLGALAAVAAYRLAERVGGVRAAWWAGVLVALHPGLLAYTPALMTEGVTASLVACAAWAASEGAARAWAARARSAGESAACERGAGEGTAQEGAAPGRGSGAGEVPWWRPWGWVLLTGVLTGLATLVRPQSLVLAPVLGWLAAGEIATARGTRGERAALWWRGWRGRGLGGAVALGAALLVCAPWTVRNCVEMKRCALVSHNGGWNLLIGTNAKGDGAWAELEVPPECREVFDEAEKDVCFGAAARRIIAARPLPWLALAPRKLAVTFDYAGAGGWYLHASNASAFPDRAKVVLGAIETVFERLVLLAALLVAARAPLARLWRRLRSRPRHRSVTGRDLLVLALALAGAISAVQLHAWVGWVVLGVLLLAASSSTASVPATSNSTASVPAAPGSTAGDSGTADSMTGHLQPPGGGVLVPATGAVVLSLTVIHAVFFGAGRYSLVAFPLVTAVAALLLSSPPAAPAVAHGGGRRARGARAWRRRALRVRSRRA